MYITEEHSFDQIREIIPDEHFKVEKKTKPEHFIRDVFIALYMHEPYNFKIDKQHILIYQRDAPPIEDNTQLINSLRKDADTILQEYINKALQTCFESAKSYTGNEENTPHHDKLLDEFYLKGYYELRYKLCKPKEYSEKAIKEIIKSVKKRLK